MSVIAIIQARTSSTRLPKKVLLDLEGETVLERVIKRVSCASLVNKVIVATSVEKNDDAIEEICSKIKVDCFRGSLNDVLDRFYHAAKKYHADHVVRITADCPLMDPSVIDQVISFHLEKQCDYTSNTLKDTYPDGEDVEVINLSALEKAWEEARLLSEREHVTPYIRKNQGVFSLGSVENSQNVSDQRWTLDNPEDYEFIKTVYRHFYAMDKPEFGMNDVLSLLRSDEKVGLLNSHIKRNEGYSKSLREDKEILLNG